MILTRTARFEASGVILAIAAASSPAVVHASERHADWTGSWAAAQQIPVAGDSIAPTSLDGATLRQTVHLSAGGAKIRLRISNAFGTLPLHLIAVHVARPLSPASSAIEPNSDRTVTFDDQDDVLIPAGAEYTSDSLDYPAAALSNLSVTMQIETYPGRATSHTLSRATSYLAAGVPASVPEMPTARSIPHWYFLSGVETAARAEASSIVALGDSITDGECATPNGNDRYTDDLAARLQDDRLAVLNTGIAGNRVLAFGTGPSALARFDRDVLAQSGVRYLIVLEGINDIGALTRTKPTTPVEHQDLVLEMIAAYHQIITSAHAHGITVIGGTIMPFAGDAIYNPGPANEQDRAAINTWIRAEGHFDAVVDFARIMADPANPLQLRPSYDCGDHLHPSPAGMHAMADAIPLHLFER